MAASSALRLDSDHPGLRVVAEVASVFGAGLATLEALTQVVGTLRRGLSLRRCRLWVRNSNGTTYSALTTPGDEAVLPGFAPPVSAWIEQGPRAEHAPSGLLLLPLPLVHDGQALGLLETMVPEGRMQGMAHDVLV